MGLDWLVHKTKPREGSVRRYHRLTRKLDRLTDADAPAAVRKKVEGALAEVSISAFEVIGAPRIGVDAEATEWFRKEVYEVQQQAVAEELEKPPPGDPAKPKWAEQNEAFILHWGRPFHVVLAEETGKYVSELAKNKDGLGRYIGMMCSAVDFRGQCVATAVVLRDDLCDEAYRDHSAEECLDYADRLEKVLEEFKRGHDDWRSATATGDYGKNILVADEVEVVEAAVKWLRFWGGHGFGYDAWS